MPGAKARGVMIKNWVVKSSRKAWKKFLKESPHIIRGSGISREYHLFPTKRYILPCSDGTFLESDDLNISTTQWTQGKVEP